MNTQGYRPTQPTRAPQGAWYAPVPTAAPPAASRRRASRAPSPVPPSAGRPRKKKSFKRQLIKLLLVLLLLAGLAAGGYVLKTQSDVRPYTSIFLDNVYVDGLNLSGMTWEQGVSAVEGQIRDKLGSWYVRLRNASGEYKDITAATLGVSRDATQALEQAWAVGHETSSVNRKDIFQLKKEIDGMKNGRLDLTSAEQSANTAPIDEILSTLERAAFIAPQDAKILSFDPDSTSAPFTFQYEVVGQQLNTAPLKEQILSMVETFTSGEVLVQPEAIQPSVTVAELQKTVSLRCRAVTPIDSHSTDARNDNIRVAFSKINGMVLNEGDRFSFNKIVGRRTQKNGFYEAFEYSYGELQTGWGGGVCQASTTVYLAAVQAGMTIVDHTAHSTPVSYTDLGKDATVTDTRGREIDFAFRNNSGGKVFLCAHVITDPSNKKRLMCEVRVYGLALENVSYTLVTEVVEKLEMPAEPEIIEDKSAKYVTYTDEQKTVIKASEGSVVDTYLVTMVSGVEQSREKIARSTYKARAERIYVGVTPR